MTIFEQFCCGSCGIEFQVPSHFARECHERGAEKAWYCPNGHRRVFRQSESEKLRLERDRLQQRLAEKDDAIAYRDKQIIAAKGQLTKARKRAAAGTCPCCKRTFSNMSTHMRKQHPDFDPAAPIKLVSSQ